MSENVIKHESEHDVEVKPETQKTASRIIRLVLQWGILSLLLLTCIMAAYRKFGG